MSTVLGGLAYAMIEAGNLGIANLGVLTAFALFPCGNYPLHLARGQSLATHASAFTVFKRDVRPHNDNRLACERRLLWFDLRFEPLLPDGGEALGLRGGVGLHSYDGGRAASKFARKPRQRERRAARAAIAAGAAICAAGCAALLWITPDTNYGVMVVQLVAIGGGLGLLVPPLTSALLGSVEKEKSGIAAGVLDATRRSGSVIGVALFGAIVARAGHFVAGLTACC